MLKHPGPLAPLCITAAFITPPAWAFWFLIAACAIIAFAILKLFSLPADRQNISDRIVH